LDSRHSPHYCRDWLLCALPGSPGSPCSPAMASAKFRTPIVGPGHISAEPTKELPPDKTLVPGLEHRQFSDEEIKQAFDTFDLDKNRFVGAMEIRHILEIVGEEATDEEIDEMIRMCDTDGDGQVTYDEFYKLMTTPPPPLPPAAPTELSKKQRQALMGPAGKKVTMAGLPAVGAPPAPPGGVGGDKSQKFRATTVESLVKKLSGGLEKIKPSQIKRIYKRFQEIDVDKSGAIEYDEFVMALEIEDNQTSRQMFRVFDMDGSGSIELKEFIVVLSRYTSAAKTEKLKFAFMMFDEDGSGFIERDELINMLSASFVVEGPTPDELEDKADKVFEFLGLDTDGAISYEDFLKLSSAKNGLVYPIQAEPKMLEPDISINELVERQRI